MMKKLFCAAIAVAAFGLSSAWAQESAVGVWKTIDDETGRTTSLIRISESNGELRGRVERLFRSADDEQDPKCVKCEGQLRDKPILGMTIITGMKKEGAEYTGGQILDPASGKVYKSKMSLMDGGRKLEVRGYIGMPMFGRSQTWLRVE